MAQDLVLTPPEFVENRESRCPVILLLDTSRSMAGEPLAQLNAGLRAMLEDLARDPLAAMRVEVAVISFGGPPELVCPFRAADEVALPPLKAGGQTFMGEALHIAADILEKRKALYRQVGVPYYRPWVFLITDGEPTDGLIWKEASARLHREEAEGRLSFFVVAVKGADLGILHKIAPPHRPPHCLDSLKFRELFQWLSVSLRRASSGRIDPDDSFLPPTDDWETVGDWEVVER